MTFASTVSSNPQGVQWAYGITVTGLKYFWHTSTADWTQSGLTSKPLGMADRNFTITTTATPKEPVDSGSGCTFDLLDDDTRYLRSYLAPRSGVETRQTTELGNASGDTSLGVFDPTIFSVNDDVYVGIETMKVDAVGGSTLTVTRGRYGSLSLPHTMTVDRVGTTVASSPRVFRGRWVRVFAAAVNPATGEVDTSSEQVIWAGRLSSISGSGGRYSLRCDPLLKALDDAWPSGLATGKIGGSTGFDTADYVPAENLYLRAFFSDGNLDVSEQLGYYDDAGTFTTLTTAGYYSLGFIAAAISDTISEYVFSGDRDKFQMVSTRRPDGVEQLLFVSLDFAGFVEFKSGGIISFAYPWLQNVSLSSTDQGGSFTFVRGSDGPSTFTVQLDDPSVPFRADTASLSSSATYGYARIERDGKKEIIRYGGVTSLVAEQGVVVLTDVVRDYAHTGQLGPVENADSISWDTGRWEAAAISIRQIAYFDAQDGLEVSVAKIVPSLLLSTGRYQGNHSTYDVLGRFQGLAMPFDFVDTDAFDVLETTGLLGAFRSFWIDENGSGGKDLENLLLFSGCCLTTRRYSNNYGISLVRNEHATGTGFSSTIDDSMRVAGSAVVSDFNERILVNTIDFNIYFGAGEQGAKPQTVNFTSSIADYGVGKKLKIDLQAGLLVDQGGVDDRAYRDFAAVCTASADRWFALYGRGNYVISFDTAHVGWLVQAGDSVRLNFAGVDSPYGDGDLSAVVGKVEKVIHRFGKNAGASFEVRVSLDPVTELAPSALVTAWGSSGNSLTLAANEFSSALALGVYEDFADDTQSDVQWFSRYRHGENIPIKVWQAGRYSAAESVSVTSTVISTRTLIVSPAISGTLQTAITNGERVLVAFADYDSASEESTRYTYIADNTDKLGTANDDAKRWD